MQRTMCKGTRRERRPRGPGLIALQVTLLLAGLGFVLLGEGAAAHGTGDTSLAVTGTLPEAGMITGTQALSQTGTITTTEALSQTGTITTTEALSQTETITTTQPLSPTAAFTATDSLTPTVTVTATEAISPLVAIRATESASTAPPDDGLKTLWPIAGLGSAALAAVLVSAMLVRRRSKRRTPTAVASSTVEPGLSSENSEVSAGRDTASLPPDVQVPAGAYLQSTADRKLRVLLGKKSILAGRDESNDLIIDDRYPGWETVSAFHARFEWDERRQRWLLVDTGSRNGVYLWDQRTGENVLHSGDRIRLGKVELELHAPDKESGT